MAIQVTAGEPLRTYLPYLYPDGKPITGAVFTVVHTERPDGLPFALTITERANGIYLIEGQTVAGDPSGEWYAVFEAPDGSRYDETWDVSATRPPQIVYQAERTTGISRGELRQIVAAELGDLETVTATSDGGRDVVISNRDLIQEVRAYSGWQIICTGGTPANVGYITKVVSSSPSDFSANVNPPFPADTHVADTFEMYNRRGVGWRVDQYNRAINTAIKRAGDDHFNLPHTVALDVPFDRKVGTIVIPEVFKRFSGISYLNYHTGPTQVPYSMYTVDRFSRTVTIKGRYREKMHMLRPVIQGYILPPLLEEDDHRTPIPTEWLIVEVKAELLGHDVSTGSTQGARDRLFYMDRQGADGRRTGIVTNYAPNTIALN